MISIQAKNLHCISDTSRVELKPINVLVGANSSGKSSFLRLFPLLRQSLNYQNQGPLLWYGDLVDFGTFKTAKKKDTSEFSLCLEFPVNFRRVIPLTKDNNLHNCTVNLTISSQADKEYLSFLKLVFMDCSISFSFTTGGRLKEFKIDEFDYSSICGNIMFSFSYDILPYIRYVNRVRNDKRTMRKLISAAEVVTKILKAEGIIRPEVCADDVDRVFQNSRIDSMDSCVKLFRSITTTNLIADYDSLFTDSAKISVLYHSILIYHLEWILLSVNASLSRCLENVYYLGPYRAASERYYRKQNLAINEIDPHGENLSMFIGNLSKKGQQDLEKWMTDSFGFFTAAEGSEGHFSVMIVDASTGEKYNVTDKGFGFSQILPIIIELWYLEEKKESYPKGSSIIYAIEQPELHLHPALIKKMTDAFIKATNEFRKHQVDFYLVLETHSSTIINRLGNAIYNKELDEDSVAILLFESQSASDSTLRKVAFNTDGVLENWPIGFFD